MKSPYQASIPLPKKVVLTLKPGTWLELKWDDSPNTRGLLLGNLTELSPKERKGDVSLLVYYPHSGDTNSNAVHTQVVGILGMLSIPAIPQYATRT